MNRKCEVSVTVVILLLLVVVVFGGATLYIWYTNYLSEAEAHVEETPTPGTEMASIINIGNDNNTFYVTIRNNNARDDITVPVAGHVIGPKEGASQPCSLTGAAVIIQPRESGVAEIVFNDLRKGVTYYIVIEIKYDGTPYAIMQLYTAV